MRASRVRRAFDARWRAAAVRAAVDDDPGMQSAMGADRILANRLANRRITQDRVDAGTASHSAQRMAFRRCRAGIVPLSRACRRLGTRHASYLAVIHRCMSPEPPR
jgi:hypothetical protein